MPSTNHYKTRPSWKRFERRTAGHHQQHSEPPNQFVIHQFTKPSQQVSKRLSMTIRESAVVMEGMPRKRKDVKSESVGLPRPARPLRSEPPRIQSESHLSCFRRSLSPHYDLPNITGRVKHWSYPRHSKPQDPDSHSSKNPQPTNAGSRHIMSLNPHSSRHCAPSPPPSVGGLTKTKRPKSFER